eukprot:scaffold8115_cov104-Isochrysis_galbana.AAC.4
MICGRRAGQRAKGRIGPRRAAPPLAYFAKDGVAAGRGRLRLGHLAAHGARLRAHEGGGGRDEHGAAATQRHGTEPTACHAQRRRGREQHAGAPSRQPLVHGHT